MHIGTDGACPVCHRGAEDVKHLLFECLHATDLWARLGISDIINEAKWLILLARSSWNIFC